MNKYTQQLVNEHSNLIIRINNLENYLYSKEQLNPLVNIENNKTQDAIMSNMIEFANQSIQLRSMKTELLAIECRLNNKGIFFEDGAYLERVAKIVKEEPKPIEKDNDGDGC